MPFVACLVLLVVAQLLTLWGVPILLTGDQKTYLSIAAEMHARDSWLIPYLFGETSYLKPPLQFWATLISWKIFGLSLAAAILPSILAWGTSAYFFRQTLIHLSYPGRVADIAGILLMGTFGAMTYGTTVQMDVWILFFWTLIPYLAIKASEKPSFHRLLSVWIATGVLAWVKGPLYSVLIGLGLLFFLRRHIRSIAHWCAIAIGVGIGASWFVFLYLHDPDAFLRFLFVENGEKMGGNRSSVIGLWGAFLASLLPIGLLLPIALKRRRPNQFWITFFLPLGLFFTFFPYRVGSYLFPLTLPAVCLVAVRLFEKHLPKVAVVASYLIAIALTGLSFFLFSGDFIGLPIASSIAVLSLSCAFFMERFRPLSTALVLGLLMAITRGALVEIGNPEYVPLERISELNRDRDLRMWVQEKHWWHEFGWLSAAARRVIQTPIGGDLSAHIMQSKESIWILTEEEHSKVGSSFEQDGCLPWIRIARRGALPKDTSGWFTLKRTSPSFTRTHYICSKKVFRF